MLILQTSVAPVTYSHHVSGLPDAYSRGRIIGMYARLALYGADYLMEEKVKDWNAIVEIDEETIRLRERINLQYQAVTSKLYAWVTTMGLMFAVQP